MLQRPDNERMSLVRIWPQRNGPPYQAVRVPDVAVIGVINPQPAPAAERLVSWVLPRLSSGSSPPDRPWTVPHEHCALHSQGRRGQGQGHASGGRSNPRYPSFYVHFVLPMRTF